MPPLLRAGTATRCALVDTTLLLPADAFRSGTGPEGAPPDDPEERCASDAGLDCALRLFPVAARSRTRPAGDGVLDPARTRSTKRRFGSGDRGAALRSRPCCGTNQSGAQPLPALASTSLYDSAACAGRHPMAKSVATRPATIVRLVRAFHAAVSSGAHPASQSTSGESATESGAAVSPRGCRSLRAMTRGGTLRRDLTRSAIARDLNEARATTR